jgi:hypothetical protein
MAVYFGYLHLHLLTEVDGTASGKVAVHPIPWNWNLQPSPYLQIDVLVVCI